VVKADRGTAKPIIIQGQKNPMSACNYRPGLTYSDTTFTNFYIYPCKQSLPLLIENTLFYQQGVLLR
jgi:hypothetical protein